MTKQNSAVMLITIGCFFCFFIFGFLDNIKGPAIPVLLEEPFFNYSDGGIILMAQYAGFLAATLIAGMLAGRIGKKNIILLALGACGIGIIGFACFQGLVLLSLFMAFLGYGLGTIEVGANALITELHVKNRGNTLNLLAFFHGLGGITAPLYASAILGLGYSWRIPYAVGIIPVAIALVTFLLLQYREVRTDDEKPGISLVRILKKALKPGVMFFNIVIFLYVMAEIGLASWIVDFLKKAKSFPGNMGSLFLTLFFVGLTAGRLLGSLIVDRVGHIRMLFICTAASIICLAAGIFGPPEFAWCLPFTGLFFSIMFPTLTAAFSERNREDMVIMMSFLFAAAGAGGMIGPGLIGFVSQIAGIQTGFSLVLFYCMVMLVFLFVISRREKKT
ncbi:MAG: MFS transporter [Spirochaetaceae bacterium]|nr:MAG: MFS transporter [Spirochaetaceae bacterium]